MRKWGVSIPHWFDSKLLQEIASEILLMRFNSTLVRFKVGDSHYDLTAGLGFQFHIGSIQRKITRLRFTRQITSFNSTLVRFKAPALLTSNRVAAAFQFHIGSIQSKRLLDLHFVHRDRFNSTLVRFKDRLRGELGIPRFGFNSTLVRFKDDCARAEPPVPFFVSIPHWFDSK